MVLGIPGSVAYLGSGLARYAKRRWPTKPRCYRCLSPKDAHSLAPLPVGGVENDN